MPSSSRYYTPYYVAPWPGASPTPRTARPLACAVTRTPDLRIPLRAPAGCHYSQVRRTSTLLSSDLQVASEPCEPLELTTCESAPQDPPSPRGRAASTSPGARWRQPRHRCEPRCQRRRFRRAGSPPRVPLVGQSKDAEGPPSLRRAWAPASARAASGRRCGPKRRRACSAPVQANCSEPRLRLPASTAHAHPGRVAQTRRSSSSILKIHTWHARSAAPIAKMSRRKAACGAVTVASMNLGETQSPCDGASEDWRCSK